MKTTLERKTPLDLGEIEKIDQNTLVYAREHLGYKHPDKDRIIATNKLTEALRIIGLKPFTPVSVLQYQKAEIAKHITARLPKFFENEIIGFIMIIILSVTFVASIFGFFASTSGGVEGKKGVKILSIALPALVISSTFIIFSIIDRKRINSEAYWEKTRIDLYDGPVPEFALTTAQELHQRIGDKDLMFYIQELKVEERPNDPFLIAQLGDVSYHLEVWDEPGYHQQRMA